MRLTPVFAVLASVGVFAAPALAVSDEDTHQPPGLPSYDEGVIGHGEEEAPKCYRERECGVLEGSGVRFFFTWADERSEYVYEALGYFGWEWVPLHGSFRFYTWAGQKAIWPLRHGRICGPEKLVTVTSAHVTHINITCRKG
jgi:hypothetical protein